ncbi:MAG: AraC family transcriptional regulator [Nitrospirae bacterium]|nr:AraC family transcriptional regulator [Candidatus Manganitrophaceae bacterium]
MIERLRRLMIFLLALVVFFFSGFTPLDAQEQPLEIGSKISAQETEETSVSEASEIEDSESIESLDPKIQALKEEILELNTQLFRLQEDLLFPEDSSVVIFLSVQGGHYFTLDSVKLHLNDTLVASHLYTDREVAALGKGGIQRIYQGNLKSGDHQLVAIFSGVGPQKKDYKRAETIQIKKEKGATFIKLIVRDNTVIKQAEFIYETWH